MFNSEFFRKWHNLSLLLISFLLLNTSLIRASDGNSDQNESLKDSKIIIAVIDSPIDYDHPHLAHAIDKAYLQSLTYTFSNGRQSNLFEINQSEMQRFYDRIDQTHLKKILSFLDYQYLASVGKIGYSDVENRISTMVEMLQLKARIKVSSHLKRQLKLVTRMIHGTHVASTAIEAIPSIRMINFPMIRSINFINSEDIFESDLSPQRLAMRHELQQLTQIFHQQKVRIANLSIGSSLAAALEMIDENTDFFTRLQISKVKEDYARDAALIYREELTQFIQDNPNTIFILSAGNMGINLDIPSNKILHHTALIDEPNLAVVSSLDHRLKRSSFSNYSAVYVDFQEQGEAIYGAVPHGGFIHLSGTSMAAPKVTNHFIRLLSQYPHLKPEEAIEQMKTDLGIWQPSRRDRIRMCETNLKRRTF